MSNIQCFEDKNKINVSNQFEPFSSKWNLSNSPNNEYLIDSWQVTETNINTFKNENWEQPLIYSNLSLNILPELENPNQNNNYNNQVNQQKSIENNILKQLESSNSSESELKKNKENYPLFMNLNSLPPLSLLRSFLDQFGTIVKIRIKNALNSTKYNKYHDNYNHYCDKYTVIQIYVEYAISDETKLAINSLTKARFNRIFCSNELQLPITKNVPLKNIIDVNTKFFDLSIIQTVKYAYHVIEQTVSDDAVIIYHDNSYIVRKPCTIGLSPHQNMQLYGNKIDNTFTVEEHSQNKINIETSGNFVLRTNSINHNIPSDVNEWLETDNYSTIKTELNEEIQQEIKNNCNKLSLDAPSFIPSKHVSSNFKFATESHKEKESFKPIMLRFTCTVNNVEFRKLLECFGTLCKVRQRILKSEVSAQPTNNTPEIFFQISNDENTDNNPPLISNIGTPKEQYFIEYSSKTETFLALESLKLIFSTLFKIELPYDNRGKLFSLDYTNSLLTNKNDIKARNDSVKKCLNQYLSFIYQLYPYIITIDVGKCPIDAALHEDAILSSVLLKSDEIKNKQGKVYKMAENDYRICYPCSNSDYDSYSYKIIRPCLFGLNNEDKNRYNKIYKYLSDIYK